MASANNNGETFGMTTDTEQVASADAGAHADKASANKTGYCSPPVKTRWQKGQSGNPSGKPKGAKSLATVIKTQAKSKVVVKDATGKTKKMSKLEAIVAVLVMKALKGDTKAINTMLAQFKEHMPVETGGFIPDATAEDLEVLKDHTKLLELLNQVESQ